MVPALGRLGPVLLDRGAGAVVGLIVVGVIFVGVGDPRPSCVVAGIHRKDGEEEVSFFRILHLPTSIPDFAQGYSVDEV